MDSSNIYVLNAYEMAWQNVGEDVQQGAQQLNTRSHVCSSATNAVPSACVFPQALMATSSSAPATTTGRPRGEAPNALKFLNSPL